jgi:hypothetical protein
MATELPPLLHRSEIKFIDMTPDADLPLRILKTYLDGCCERWEVSGVGEHSEAVWDFMNQCQEKRAKILDRAIKILTPFLRVEQEIEEGNG